MIVIILIITTVTTTTIIIIIIVIIILIALIIILLIITTTILIIIVLIIMMVYGNDVHPQATYRKSYGRSSPAWKGKRERTCKAAGHDDTYLIGRNSRIVNIIKQELVHYLKNIQWND